MFSKLYLPMAFAMGQCAQEASHFFLSMVGSAGVAKFRTGTTGRRHDDLAGCDKQLSVPAIRADPTRPAADVLVSDAAFCWCWPGMDFALFGPRFFPGATSYRAAASLPLTLSGTTVMFNSIPGTSVLREFNQVNGKFPTSRRWVFAGRVFRKLSHKSDAGLREAAAAPGILSALRNPPCARSRSDLNSQSNPAAVGFDHYWYLTGLDKLTIPCNPDLLRQQTPSACPLPQQRKSKAICCMIFLGLVPGWWSRSANITYQRRRRRLRSPL